MSCHGHRLSDPDALGSWSARRVGLRYREVEPGVRALPGLDEDADLPGPCASASGVTMTSNRREAHMPVPLLDLKAQYASIRDEMHDAVDLRPLESPVLYPGPEVQALEAEVAEYSHCQYGIGVSSGNLDVPSSRFMAIGVGPGDGEVITTPTPFSPRQDALRAWAPDLSLWTSIRTPTTSIRAASQARSRRTRGPFSPCTLARWPT